jgi:hypothetical protein
MGRRVLLSAAGQRGSLDEAEAALQERGMLLAVTAIRDEQPFYKITTLTIGFDEPIVAETFQFEPPEGPSTVPKIS